MQTATILLVDGLYSLLEVIFDDNIVDPKNEVFIYI